MEDWRIGCFYSTKSAVARRERKIVLFREMKPYFSNQNDMEDDIKEYIGKTVEEHKEIYHMCMKEMVWTLDFLLSNPHVNVENELEDLRAFMRPNNENYLKEFQAIQDKMYQQHFMMQLPNEIQEEFEKKIAGNYYDEYFLDGPIPDLWFPFEDPTELNCATYEDVLMIYLKMLSEYVFCKKCGKKFKANSILKHLQHPFVNCKEYYSFSEIRDMKNHSEIRTLTKIKEWKLKTYPKYFSKQKKIYYMNKKADEEINGLAWGAINGIMKKHEQKGFQFHLKKVYDILMKRCKFERDDKMADLKISIEELLKTSSSFINEIDVKEDISECKKEIESEITETFQHLEKAINRKYHFYIGKNNHFYWVRPKPSCAALQYDAMQLLHYIKWRHENSYAMICEMMNLLANNIQKQMINSSEFPIDILKQPEIYDFQMLSHDKVPNYDASEGLKVVRGPYIEHPKDHPYYPHYCFPVIKIEYDEWLSETADFKTSKLVPFHRDKEPELCACKKDLYKKGICNLNCTFDELNPEVGCNYYPKCKGCHETIENGVVSMNVHFRKNPMCYNAYSHEQFVDFENKIKVLKIGEIQTCQVCNFRFESWEILKHIDENEQCKIQYTPEQIIELEKLSEVTRNQLEIATSGKVQCRGCSEGFELWNIFKHINTNTSCEQKWSDTGLIELWNIIVCTRDRKSHYMPELIPDFDPSDYDDWASADNFHYTLKLMNCTLTIAWQKIAKYIKQLNNYKGPRWPEGLKF